MTEYCCDSLKRCVEDEQCVNTNLENIPWIKFHTYVDFRKLGKDFKLDKPFVFFYCPFCGKKL